MIQAEMDVTVSGASYVEDNAAGDGSTSHLMQVTTSGHG